MLNAMRKLARSESNKCLVFLKKIKLMANKNPVSNSILLFVEIKPTTLSLLKLIPTSISLTIGYKESTPANIKKMVTQRELGFIK